MKMKIGEPGATDIRLSDLSAAALLLARGCELQGIEASPDPRRQVFVLRGNPSTIRGLLDAYACGEVSIQLDGFLAAQRLLKDRLFRAARLSR